jgi:hypothetical protein
MHGDASMAAGEVFLNKYSSNLSTDAAAVVSNISPVGIVDQLHF